MVILKAFSRRTDRNLKKPEDSDLLHLLHEKQLRHNRFIRAQSLFNPSAPSSRQMSPAGSLSEFPGTCLILLSEFQVTAWQHLVSMSRLIILI